MCLLTYNCPHLHINTHSAILVMENLELLKDITTVVVKLMKMWI